MIAGHLGPALVAKSLTPELHLGLAVVCCFLPDIVRGTMVLVLRRGQWAHGNGWSHSLLFSVTIALLIFIVAAAMGLPRLQGLLYGACVLSHWGLDLVTKPILPFGWGSRGVPGVGLSFWHPRLHGLLEWTLLAGGATLLVSAQGLRVETLGLLLGVSLAQILRPPFTPSAPSPRTHQRRPGRGAR
jgi:hypothetical protein